MRTLRAVFGATSIVIFGVTFDLTTGIFGFGQAIRCNWIDNGRPCGGG